MPIASDCKQSHQSSPPGAGVRHTRELVLYSAGWRSAGAAQEARRSRCWWSGTADTTPKSSGVRGVRDRDSTVSRSTRRPAPRTSGRHAAAAPKRGRRRHGRLPFAVGVTGTSVYRRPEQPIAQGTRSREVGARDLTPGGARWRGALAGRAGGRAGGARSGQERPFTGSGSGSGSDARSYRMAVLRERSRTAPSVDGSRRFGSDLDPEKKRPGSVGVDMGGLSNRAQHRRS